MSSDDDTLTTTQVAKILHCSRQHVAQLCDSGQLQSIRRGTHRRIRRGDLTAYLRPSLRREEEQSLWLHLAVAAKLIVDPDRVINIGRANLAKHRGIHNSGRSDVWHNHWERILDEGVDAILDTLTSKTSMAVELRQTGVFAGVIDQNERTKLLAAFRAHWASHRTAA